MDTKVTVIGYKSNDNLKKASKFGLTFYERNTGKEESSIYVRATYKGKNYSKSLALTCRAGTLKASPLEVTGDKALTDLLKVTESEITKAVNELRISGRKIVPKAVLESVLKDNNLIDGAPSFSSLLDKFMELKKLESERGEIERSTFERYQRGEKRLKAFLQSDVNKYPVELEDVTRAAVKRFISHCMNDLKLSGATIQKHIDLGRSVYNNAIDNQYYQYNPFKRQNLPKSESKIKQNLSEGEIITIRDLELSGEVYQTIRDQFVFQCYTGLSYTDLKNLKWSEIKDEKEGKTIIRDREKSGVETTVLLWPPALEILQRIGQTGSKYCFNVNSNQQFNRVLKEIAAAAGIHKGLSSHWARRSFARLMVDKGVPPKALQGALGHKDLKMAQNYYYNTSKELTVSSMEALKSKLK